ncbi:MAG: 6,7-dimethyl-8-ribityllumazine synthase [Pseudomonadota bacterium]
MSSKNSQSNSFKASGVRPERIAFIQSRWHHDIVDQCRLAFMKRIKKEGFAPRSVEIFAEPGAFEIPLQAKLLASTGRYAAIVAAGLVVDGGIYRHEFVAGSVIDALMRSQIDSEVPIISAVLTPLRFHEHDEHRAFFQRHFVTKGIEAAVACAETISNIRALKKQAYQREE